MFGNRLPIFQHSFQMKFNRLADVVLNLLDRLSCGDASRKIGHIGGQVVLAALDQTAYFFTVFLSVRLE